MRILSLFVAGLLTFASLLAAPLLERRSAIAESSEQQRFDEVRSKLEGEYATLGAQGYKREALEIVMGLSATGGAAFQLELGTGNSYAVVAACDGRCPHVEVTIDDPDGNRLAQSPEKASVVIVGGTPVVGGMHRGVVRVPGCAAEWCQVGISVLHQPVAK